MAISKSHISQCSVCHVDLNKNTVLQYIHNHKEHIWELCNSDVSEIADFDHESQH